MTKLFNILETTLKLSFLSLISLGLICVLYTVITKDAANFTFNI